MIVCVQHTCANVSPKSSEFPNRPTVLDNLSSLFNVRERCCSGRLDKISFERRVRFDSTPLTLTSDKSRKTFRRWLSCVRACFFTGFLENVDLNDKNRYFHCRDGRFLPADHRCNSKAECLHGDDEIGCETPACDERLQFRCDSGECVESEKRCDNLYDCWDKTDEIGCGKCAVTAVITFGDSLNI